MRISLAGAGCLAVAASIVLAAQVNPLSKAPAYAHSGQSLEQKGADLLAAAPKSNGIAEQRFETYPGSFTELIGRTASGVGELHQRWQDNFVAVSGEATVTVGGRVVDGKETAPGEIRGTRVEGGQSYTLHKGDTLHVAANTPHQTMLAPNGSFVYYVIKVEEPSARLMPAAK